ncbi:MAG: DUF3575 domain-containing protein [Flavobacteriales bacterium]
MKSSVFLFILLFCHSIMQGQKTLAENSLELNVDPIGCIILKPNLGIDYNFSDKWSIETTIGYRVPYESDLVIRESTRLEINLIPKYYFDQTEDSKVYGSIFARFAQRKATTTLFTEEERDFTRTKFGIGMLLGVKLETDVNIIFDANLGIGQSLYRDIDYNGGSEDDIIEDLGVIDVGLLLTGKISIGYRFGKNKAPVITE